MTAKDLATGVMGKVEDKFKKIYEQGSLAGKAMDGAFAAFKAGTAIMGAGIGILAATAAAADAYGAMDDALDKVALHTRLTADGMEVLEDAAYRAGLSTKFKPEEAVDGLEVLAKKFNDAGAAAANITPVLNLAAISMGDLGVAQAAKLATDTITQFNLTAADTSDVVDTFAKAQQVTSLSTKDFGGAFKRASVTASQFNQTLDDTLIGVGLFKSRGMEGGEAAMQYSQSLQNLATDTKAQAELQSKHVEVFDKTTKKMRGLTDILGDVVKATKDMTEQDRTAFVRKALGTKGMATYDAAAKATFKTMVDGKEVTLQGAEAIAEMTKQMGDAKNAAQDLTDAMLDDIGGQQEMIGSALSTIKTMVGKQFAIALEPAARAVVGIIRKIGTVILEMPEPLKQGIAKFVIFAGVLTTAAGALLAGSAGIAILILGLKMIGATMLSVLIPMLGFVAMIGLAIAGIAALRYAVMHNLGGIGDFIHKVIDRVVLTWKALVQLFTQGGFSGAVREAMGDKANAPIREFAITVFLWFNRIKNFFKGLAGGFEVAMQAARPAFAAFVGALEHLGRIFGIVQDGPDVAKGKFIAWGKAGERVGVALGAVMETIVTVMTAVLDIASGVASGFSSMSPITSTLGSSLGVLFDAFGEIVDAIMGTDGAVGNNRSGWETLGLVIGKVVGAIVGAVSVLVTVVAEVAAIVAGVIGAVRANIKMAIGIITGLIDVVVALLHGDWAGAWESAKGIVFKTVEGILDIVGSLIQGVASAVDKLGKLFGKDLGFANKVGEIRSQLVGAARDALATQQQKDDAAKDKAASDKKENLVGDGSRARPFIGVPNPPAFGPPAAAGTAPGVAATASAAAPAAGDAGAAAAAATGAAVAAALRSAPPAVVSAKLVCDGEVMAKVVTKYQRAAASSDGTPTAIDE